MEYELELWRDLLVDFMHAMEVCFLLVSVWGFDVAVAGVAFLP